MKLASLFFLALLTAAPAAEVAVLSIQVPNEKQPKQVTIELYPEAAPQTVANFEKLARKKFYKGMAFHRALPGRLVQIGDPLSRKKKPNLPLGTGGPGYVVPAEIKLKHQRGTVAMGRLPNRINPNKASNGSQFYVTLVPAPTLDGEYTVFGKVTSGLEVLEAISHGETDSNNAPLVRSVIRSIQIVQQ
ncbi:MAG: peptidylprolyl isomerase [Chthoniobacterales bacterium]